VIRYYSVKALCVVACHEWELGLKPKELRANWIRKAGLMSHEVAETRLSKLSGA